MKIVFLYDLEDYIWSNQEIDCIYLLRKSLDGLKQTLRNKKLVWTKTNTKKME